MEQHELRSPALPPRWSSPHCNSASQPAGTFPLGQHAMQILLTYCSTRQLYLLQNICAMRALGARGRQPGRGEAQGCATARGHARRAELAAAARGSAGSGQSALGETEAVRRHFCCPQAAP